jgi:pyruvate/2-oxoglutarate/acetoin dehydrogenase E1 component
MIDTPIAELGFFGVACGAAMMGMPLEELIAETILALRGAAEAVGLKGTL